VLALTVNAIFKIQRRPSRRLLKTGSVKRVFLFIGTPDIPHEKRDSTEGLTRRRRRLPHTLTNKKPAFARGPLSWETAVQEVREHEAGPEPEAGMRPRQVVPSSFR
jgi:hypothetical protein